MPPSRHAHRTHVSPFRSIGGMACFEKQLQIFGAYGCVYDQLELPSGDIVVKGDCVEVGQGKDHSATSYRGERWFLEVIEIKGVDEETENEEATSRAFNLDARVLTRVSPSQLADLRNFHCTVGNLTRCPFSKNELALSNHQQIIAASTILRKVPVRFFNELDREQDIIKKGELWYRFRLRVGPGPVDNRLVLGKNRPLPPARCAVETCTKRYKPDEDYQRLCPRASCGFWYHNQCLENVRFERSDSWHYNHRLQAMLTGTTQVQNAKDMDGNDIAEVPPACYDWFNEAIEEERNGVIDTKFPRYEDGSIANIVWCAQTPVSRGGRYGIVGNERIIAEARGQLKEIWDCRESDLFPPDEIVAQFLAYKEPPKERMFSCMRCSLAI